MYSRLLVPLDRSDLSKGILPYASSLARAFHIPIDLLHVIEPEIISPARGSDTARQFHDAEVKLKNNLSRYLDETAQSYLPSLTVNCIVEIGHPAKLIVEKASRNPDTLIAMATHGRSGVGRWLLGSVADKVLHACTNPLFLARTAGMNRANGHAEWKVVQVPLDGSPLAELVLPHVTAIANRLKLKVVLIRAFSVPGKRLDFEDYLTDVLEVGKMTKREAENYLKIKVQEMQDNGLGRVSYTALEGAAAGVIIDIARETPDNLLAMCTHGRSGIMRWMLGSITDRVVRYSGDPVLVIRAPAKK